MEGDMFDMMEEDLGMMIPMGFLFVMGCMERRMNDMICLVFRLRYS